MKDSTARQLTLPLSNAFKCGRGAAGSRLNYNDCMDVCMYVGDTANEKLKTRSELEAKLCSAQSRRWGIRGHS
jgi:hypothetical protein